MASRQAKAGRAGDGHRHTAAPWEPPGAEADFTRRASMRTAVSWDQATALRGP